MRHTYRRHHSVTGFTLIEVMLVIALVGVMVAAIQFTFSANKPENKLHQAAERFSAVFHLAAEYALLNNVELGLAVKDNQYQFVGFDGVRWQVLPEQAVFAPETLSDDLILTLKLDDLPVEETLLTRESLAIDEQDNRDVDKDQLIIPQVYILSGGDITPFSLSFRFADEFALAVDYQVQVTGLYSIPLSTNTFVDGQPLAAEGE